MHGSKPLWDSYAENKPYAHLGSERTKSDHSTQKKGGGGGRNAHLCKCHKNERHLEKRVGKAIQECLFPVTSSWHMLEKKRLFTSKCCTVAESNG